MNRYYRIFRTILLPVFITALFPSCYKDLELPGTNGTKKIALLGELVAGDSLLLRAGQSIAISKNNALKLQLLRDLSISAKDSFGNNYILDGKEDMFSSLLFTIPFRSGQKVTANNTYTVTAVHPVLGTATARVYVPRQIDAQITDTQSQRGMGDTLFRIKVKINDPADTKDYYVVEAVKQQMFINRFFLYDGNWLPVAYNQALYDKLKAQGNLSEKADTSYRDQFLRLPLYTSDTRTENVEQKGPFTSAKRILIKDKSFNGGSIETMIQVEQNTLYLTGEIIKGRTIIYLKAVSEDYFNFLKSYELSDPSVSYSSFEQPIKIEGNINNGYGILGGVSQVKYVYILDSW